jgi:hypothetical protein
LPTITYIPHKIKGIEVEIKDKHNRRIVLSAFANSVKTSGKAEWVISAIAFSVIGSFLATAGIKYLSLSFYANYIAIPFIVFTSIYVGHEIYLSRVIRGAEIKSFLEIASLSEHLIDRISKMEQAFLKELDIVIDIKKDVLRDEKKKEQISDLSADKIQQDIEKTSDDGMVFKSCKRCKEDVYVAKQMDKCPFCWGNLSENLSDGIEDAEDAEEL